MDTVQGCMRKALITTEACHKCNAKLFTRRRKDVMVGILMVYGSELSVSRKVKYLGVTLDIKPGTNTLI